MSYTAVPTVVDGDDLTEDFTLAVKDAVDELQLLLPKTFTANISSAPVTSGTTTLVMWSLSIPAQDVAGTVLVWMLSGGNQSVGTDIFDLGPSFDGGTNFSAINRRTGTGTAPGTLINAYAALAASTAMTVSACAKRQSGTGTYAPSNDARFNKLTALWVPDAP